MPAESAGGQANPDAGEGARAKREEGRVGAVNKLEVKRKEMDRQIAENTGVLSSLRESGDLDGMFGSSGLDANLSGGVGGLIGGKGAKIGSGGLGVRGSGLGGGGTAEGLGGLGAKGYGGNYAMGSGKSGYGSGGGNFGAIAGSGTMVLGSNPRHRPQAGPLAQDYTHVGHNPVELASKDWLSTFSIDVDTASYTQARRQIQAHTRPVAASVRTEEFVNYFRYNYPEPDPGQPFSVTMDGADNPWQGGHHLLRVGIRGATDERSREPVHLTFLVDVSGSMRSADKLPLAKRALVHLVEHLEEGDTVAIATYAGGPGIALHPTDAANQNEIVYAINHLANGGGTAMASGMQAAYDMAYKTRVLGEENRVIVLSDGDANIGPASHEGILKAVSGYANKGITLSTVGFGRGNYRDTLMEQLADKGDGNYSYIDSMDEAKRVFGEDLGATLRTIARDVKIQVEFNRDNVLAYKLIGYENREIADKDFRNDAVDAGEVGAGHTVTALYDIILRDHVAGNLATVRVRHKEPGPDRPAKEQAVKIPVRGVQRGFDAASRDLRRAFGAASFAEKLRDAKQMEEVSWTQIADLVQNAKRTSDDRDAELLGLVQNMVQMGKAVDMEEAWSVGVDSNAAPGDPTILGALDRLFVDEIIARHANQIRYCYQRELTKIPNMGGDLVVKFVVNKDGSVSQADLKRNTMGNQAVESCVLSRFMRMQFPQPAGGGIAIVSYPLRFSPV